MRGRILLRRAPRSDWIPRRNRIPVRNFRPSRISPMKALHLPDILRVSVRRTTYPQYFQPLAILDRAAYNTLTNSERMRHPNPLADIIAIRRTQSLIPTVTQGKLPTCVRQILTLLQTQVR